PGLKSVTIDAYLSDVVGLVEMKEGKADSVTGITVSDPYTITFKLKQPTPYFLGKLTYMVSSPISRDSALVVQEVNNISQAIGTGPFKLVRYEENQLAVLEANPDYWGGKPKLDRIERVVAKDPTAKLNQYKAGDFEIVQLQRQDIGALQKDEKY